MRETKRLREPDYDWLTGPGEAAYIAALHKEVVESKERDFCTGTPQQWRLLAPVAGLRGGADTYPKVSAPASIMSMASTACSSGYTGQTSMPPRGPDGPLVPVPVQGGDRSSRSISAAQLVAVLYMVALHPTNEGSLPVGRRPLLIGIDPALELDMKGV
jgi:hypothetical protein